MLPDHQYVEVAFPMQFDQTFTYRWPENFSVDPLGYRVLVPFHKRILTGYVLRQSDESSYSVIKDVQDVLDEAPVLTLELIALIHDLTERYGATLGEALQTVVPAGLLQQTKKKMIATEKAGLPDSLEERKVVEWIRNKKITDWSTWKKKNPDSIALLNKLQRDGWIQFQTLFQGQRVTEPTETIYLKSTSDHLTEIRGKKQKQVYEAIQNQGQLALSSLKEIFGADISATLRVLETKQVLQKKIIKLSQQDEEFPTSQNHTLTDVQKTIVDQIEEAIKLNKPDSMLIHGVTGSGKTEVYLQSAQRCLNLGRNVLALVPEISLTPQFLARFKSRFGSKVALLHSQRSETERVMEWKRILEGKAQIVVGTRSSVFSPLKNIGLIIFDEEHDRSYKQQDHVMYHAKEIAKVRAESERAVTLYGSATPSIETYYESQVQKIRKVSLPNRIRQQDMPEVTIVDLQKEKNFGEKNIFSEILKQAIEDTLKEKKQVILFLNRRGYSTHVFCPGCGTSLQCPNCAISMTYHREQDSFLCHYCDFTLDTEHPCPNCKVAKWIRFGFGTERVEKELRFLFPDAVVDRLDRDTSRKKNAFDRAFTDFFNRKTDILIGTQMIAKGLDFEHVDLVGVLLADQGLHFPDFRASEQTFQLLTQVIGRSGRGNNRGRAILQTLQPNHYAITTSAQQNYEAFYDREIQYRQKTMYPPFSRAVLFEIRGRDEKIVGQMAHWLRKQVEKVQSNEKQIEIMGPSPAPIEKINSNYRMHLFIKAKLPTTIDKSMKWIYTQSKEEFHKRNLHLTFNIDPYDFM